MKASGMARLTVKNWKQFQHYTGRRPPWIKLHRGLLDDVGFHRLPVASRALAPFVWLLASESDDGSIPADVETLAFRFRCSAEDVIDRINPLIEEGLLVGDLTFDSDTLASGSRPASLEEKRDRGRERTEPPLPPPSAAAERGSPPDGVKKALLRAQDELEAYWRALGGRPNRKDRRKLWDALRSGHTVAQLRGSISELVREDLVTAGKLDPSADWPPDVEVAQPP